MAIKVYPRCKSSIVTSPSWLSSLSLPLTISVSDCSSPVCHRTPLLWRYVSSQLFKMVPALWRQRESCSSSNIFTLIFVHVAKPPLWRAQVHRHTHPSAWVTISSLPSLRFSYSIFYTHIWHGSSRSWCWLLPTSKPFLWSGMQVSAYNLLVLAYVSNSQLRLFNALRFVHPSQRAEHGPTPSSIFQPLITSSHCSLSEMDFNLHSKRSFHLHGQFPLDYTHSKRVQQHLLFRPRHRPNAPVMHPLLRWYRPSLSQTRQRRPQCPTRQLHNQARRRQMFLQTWDPPLRALRDVDSSLDLGNQMAVYHYAFHPQRRHEQR